MDRDVVWALVGIGAACWALGGAGQKWVRRYVWPVILGASALVSGIGLMRSMLGLASTSAVLHLGYGDSAKPVQRAVVFFLYGCCLIPFGVPWWFGFVTMGLLSIGFQLSRRLNWFTWKWWELTAGALQGVAIARQLLSG